MTTIDLAFSGIRVRDYWRASLILTAACIGLAAPAMADAADAQMAAPPKVLSLPPGSRFVVEGGVMIGASVPDRPQRKGPPAGAESTIPPAPDQKRNRTTVMIGAGIQYRPDYIGSNDYELARYIKVSARFGDAIVSTSGRLGFLSYRFGRFAVGPIIRLERGRTENNNVALIGLGDIGRTVEGGLYIGYWGKWINVIGSFRHGIATGHNASMASVQFTSYLIRTPNFGLSASIKGTWASAKYMKRFFAINAEQAAASGYPIHNIGAGVRDIRLILLAQYWFNDAWALNAFVHYSRLTVAVAGSPIVALEGAANQVAVGLYLSYTI